MSFRDEIKVNDFSSCHIEEVKCHEFCTSLMEERHYYLKELSGKVLAEYEVRYYSSNMCAEIGYWRVDQSENSKGCVTYGFNKICSSLFSNDTIYVFLRINDENKESLNIARNSGFIRKNKDDNIYIKLNPQAEKIIENAEMDDLFKSVLLDFVKRLREINKTEQVI